MMYEILFSMILLTQPVGTPTTISEADWATLKPIIRDLAVEWQVLDPREANYIFSVTFVRTELDIVRGRYQELKDAPLVEDGERFPPREFIRQMMDFNRAYLKTLTLRYESEPKNQFAIRDAMEETERMYCLMDILNDSRVTYYYVAVRRRALQQVRDEWLGPEAYYAGRLPPPVPVWRFQPIH